MILSRASALAVYAVTYLAEQSASAPVQGRTIAEALDARPDTLLKLLQQLVKGGVLESVRGPNGGFSLRKKPGDISLLSLVEIIDGPLESRNSPSSGASSLKVKHGLDQAHEQVAAFAHDLLASRTIADLEKDAPV